MTRDEVLELVVGDRRVRIRQQLRRGRERRLGPVGGEELVRRPERQNLPPGLPGGLEPVHEAVCLVAEPAARQGGGMKEDSRGAWQLHRSDSCRSSKL
jgi:hypothetical protein